MRLQTERGFRIVPETLSRHLGTPLGDQSRDPQSIVNITAVIARVARGSIDHAVI
jgi:hypothetical protein